MYLRSCKSMFRNTGVIACDTSMTEKMEGAMWSPRRKQWRFVQNTNLPIRTVQTALLTIRESSYKQRQRRNRGASASEVEEESEKEDEDNPAKAKGGQGN